MNIYLLDKEDFEKFLNNNLYQCFKYNKKINQDKNSKEECDEIKNEILYIERKTNETNKNENNNESNKFNFLNSDFI